MSNVINDVTHDLFNKLRIISKIKEGQKLDVSNGGLNVYTDGWINWFFRKWNRDNKDEGIRQLRDLYRSIQQSIETVVDESKYSISESKRIMAMRALINAASELKSSIRGLDNMRKTYAGYPATIASLDGILKDYVMVTYSLLLEAIPKNKLTPELRETITYCNNVIYRGEDDYHINSIAISVQPAVPIKNENNELPPL